MSTGLIFSIEGRHFLSFASQESLSGNLRDVRHDLDEV